MCELYWEIAIKHILVMTFLQGTENEDLLQDSNSASGLWHISVAPCNKNSMMEK